MAEVQMDLESDEPLRLQVVDGLRRALASPGGREEQWQALSRADRGRGF